MKNELANIMTGLINPSASTSARKKKVDTFVNYLSNNSEDVVAIKSDLTQLDEDPELGLLLFENIIKHDGLIEMMASKGYTPSLETLYQYFSKKPDFTLWKKLCGLYKFDISSIVGVSDKDTLGQLFHINLMNEIGVAKWLDACRNAPFTPRLYFTIIEDYNQQRNGSKSHF